MDMMWSSSVFITKIIEVALIFLPKPEYTELYKFRRSSVVIVYTHMLQTIPHYLEKVRDHARVWPHFSKHFFHTQYIVNYYMIRYTRKLM